MRPEFALFSTFEVPPETVAGRAALANRLRSSQVRLREVVDLQAAQTIRGIDGYRGKMTLKYSEAVKVINYDPVTGRLEWLPRIEGMPPGKLAYWNSKFSGKEAFTASNRGGYKRGFIWGKEYRAHQIAWLLSTKEFPVGEIDHINGDKADNRIENLRLSSRGENMRNKKTPTTNTSGAVGVSWHKRASKWEAHIEFEGKKKHLGLFVNIDDAIAARESAAKAFGFHENHGHR